MGLIFNSCFIWLEEYSGYDFIEKFFNFSFFEIKAENSEIFTNFLIIKINYFIC